MDGYNMNADNIETSSTNTNNMDHNHASDISTNTINPNMDDINAWPVFIDPQLLESELLEPTTFGHGAPPFEQRDESMDDAPHEIEEASHESRLHYHHHQVIEPITPQPTLRRLPILSLQTPPQSQPSVPRLNAQATTFEPGSALHDATSTPLITYPHHIGNVSAASNMVQALQGGYLTPTSAASAERRHHEIYSPGSPTPQMPQYQEPLQQFNSGNQAWPTSYGGSMASVEGSAPAYNVHGSQAGVAAIDDMRGWVEHGPYNPRNTFQSADHLSPPALVQPGRQRSPSQGSFACTNDSCPKTFATKAERDHHERYHGNKDHVCGVCNKGFHFPKDLKRHAKIHNPRERHLLCTILHCKYHTRGFHRQDHLNRHMEKVHGRASARNSTRNSTPA